MHSALKAEIRELLNQALSQQAAAHAAEMSARDLAIADLKAVVEALTASGAPTVKPNFVQLKPACGQVGVDYENARRWCERGFVVARKDGGRWFVDQQSLAEYARR